MAYERKPIYQFIDTTETGVDATPLDRLVYVESNNILYKKDNDTGLTSSSTIQEAIDNLNLVFIKTAAKTATPILSGDSVKEEADIAVIKIENYEEFEYSISVSGGDATQENDTIIWKLPRVVSDTVAVISVSCTQDGYAESGTATHEVFVQDIPVTDDQAVLFDNSNMDLFCKRVNTGLTSGELVADDNLGDIQDSTYTSDAHTIYIDNSKVDVEVGDTIKTDSETFRVGTVSNDGNRIANRELNLITHGSNCTFFVGSDNALYTIGTNEFFGVSRISSTTPQLFKDGDANIINNIREMKVSGAPDKQNPTVINFYILKKDNSLWGMGANNYGQLNDGGTTSDFLYFHKISDDVISFDAPEECVVFIKTDGTMWGVGKNNHGQLGDNSTVDRTVLTQENSNSTNNIMIACGDSHTMVLKTDGTVFGCGNNAKGQIGVGGGGDKTTLIQESSNSTNNKYITCTEKTTLVLKTDGTMFGCGYNAKYLIGDGTSNDKNSLTQESTLSTDIKMISVSAVTTLVLKTDGTVFGCGVNTRGQLGVGDKLTRDTLTQESTLSTDNVNVYTFEYNSFIGKTNSVLGCGESNYGELGVAVANTTTESLNFFETIIDAAKSSDISGYYSKYWVNPETDLTGTPTNCYLQNHRATSCDIQQDATDKDWKGINTAQIVEGKTDVIGTTVSTTTKIYLDDAVLEAKIGDLFVTDSSEIFEVDTIIESPNYYVTPVTPLTAAPTEVYPVSKVYINDTVLPIDSVAIATDITQTLTDTAYPTTRMIGIKVSQGDTCVLKEFSGTLEKEL